MPTPTPHRAPTQADLLAPLAAAVPAAPPGRLVRSRPPAPAPRQRVYTVINQKGGVGKTTIVCHLALAAREAGLRTLVVDLDTQGSASVLLTRDLSIASTPGGAEELFSEGDLPAPFATPFGVDLLHGHQYLDRVDGGHHLEDAARLALRLRRLAYDLVVIDTPPAVGTRHLVPLLWTDVALTPLEPSSSSVQGFGQTQSSLRTARRLNPRLRSRVIINRHIRSSRRQRAYIRDLERRIPLVRPFLTQRVHIHDALDEGVPVWRYRRAARELRETWRTFCRGLLAA